MRNASPALPSQSEGKGLSAGEIQAQTPSDSITHQAMPFHLKRAFFINNFVILGAVPIGKKSVASAHFPGRGSGVGGGVSAMLAGTSAKTDA